MIRPPPAPIVSSALSGFVIGVILTLIATGSILHSSSGTGLPTPQPTPSSTQAPNLNDATIASRLRVLVARQLGPSPEKSQPRLIKLTVSPGSPINPLQPDATGSLRTVVIRFRLNNHPLGGTWRLRAAKADVFLVLRGLYTSGLPIGSVDMTGLFPLKTGNPRIVLRVYLESETAARVPWRKMGRNEVNEARLWKMLNYKWVDPRFG